MNLAATPDHVNQLANPHHRVQVQVVEEEKAHLSIDEESKFPHTDLIETNGNNSPASSDATQTPPSGPRRRLFHFQRPTLRALFPFLYYTKAEWIDQLKPRNHLPKRMKREKGVKRDWLAELWLSGTLIILTGIGMSVQTVINGQLGIQPGSNPAFASMISYTVGTFILFVFWVASMKGDFTKIKWKQLPHTVPYHAWTGGATGAGVIIIVVLCAPYLGAGAVLGLFVCSQIVYACVMDTYALMGVNYREFTLYRLAGVLLLVASVVVIVMF